MTEHDVEESEQTNGIIQNGATLCTLLALRHVRCILISNSWYMEFRRNSISQIVFEHAGLNTCEYLDIWKFEIKKRNLEFELLQI